MRTMGWVLNEAGFELTAARNSSELAGRLHELPPEVVVFNAEMAGDERMLCVALVREFRPLPSIVELHRPQGGNELGATSDAEVHTPFHADDLVGAIQRVLSERAVR